MVDDDGWSKEFTSLKSFAKWAERAAKIARVFSSYSQGLSIVQAVEKVAVEDTRPGSPSKPKRVNKCDMVKTEIISWLRGRMSEYLQIKLSS